MITGSRTNSVGGGLPGIDAQIASWAVENIQYLEIPTLSTEEAAAGGPEGRGPERAEYSGVVGLICRVAPHFRPTDRTVVDTVPAAVAPDSSHRIGHS